MNAFSVAFLSVLVPFIQVAVNSREAVVAERQGAYETICSGRVMEGATALLESLHSMPREDVSVADDAFASVQLLLFTMGCLMDDEMHGEFVKKALNPEEIDLDKFLITAQNLSLGLETADKNAAARDLQTLAMSKDPMVRIAANYLFAEPYYFESMSQCAAQARERLAAEFPNLELTREALRLPVYHVRVKGPEEMAKALADLEKAEATRSIVQSDKILTSVKTALAGLASGAKSGETVARLTDSLTVSADWRERYSNLHMLEFEKDGPARAQIESACSALAARPSVTPDVARAQIFMSRFARDEGNAREMRQWAEILISQERTCEPFERILYEDVLFEVQGCAEALIKNGAKEDAIKVLTALSEKYPNSAVAKRYAASIGQLKQEVGAGK